MSDNKLNSAELGAKSEGAKAEARLRKNFPELFAMAERAIELSGLKKAAELEGDELRWIIAPASRIAKHRTGIGWTMFIGSRRLGPMIAFNWEGENGTDEEHAEAIVSAIEGVANFVVNDLLQKHPYETAH